MRVVHVSRFETGGGAALAANRLHGSLRRQGVDSTMFVAEKLTDDPAVTVFQPPRDLLSRLRRRLQYKRLTYSMRRYESARLADQASFNDDRVPGGRDLVTQLPAGDVINIHVMYGFADYRTFLAAVPQHTPVVRTLHEMSFFTGGCHYDVGCGKYTERCGACPRLGSHRERDLSRQIWRRKRAILSTIAPGRLHLVAPSRWLANEAKRSSLLQKFPVTVIPLALDTEVFCPRDRRGAREALGIPSDALVVLFVASLISQPIKGLALLVEALNGLGHLRDLLLLSVGRGQPPVEVQIPHLPLGYLGNERLRSLVYSAADVFVIPSLYDNLPQTVLEATACGTPVVGFAVGGIPDMVRPGITGLLVPALDVNALRAAIRALLQDRTRRAEMAANCRRIAVAEYALEVQARRYIELYEMILAGVRHEPLSQGGRDAVGATQGITPYENCSTGQL
jgi:glycosyltransferase involved in cell wall biosynthesis